MSAITTIFRLNKQPVHDPTVRQMLDSLKHRGEEKVGVWVDNNVGLGQRMKWTTEESKLETLPSKNGNSGNVIVCDARIDNREDLISQLEFNDKKRYEITDSTIILAAYEKWGKDCLPKLIGDFIFVIWNPTTKSLFCARDPLGVKHFYYYHEPHKIFAIASEIKALFCLSEIPRKINEENLGDYLVFNNEDKESTPFANIKRLPATHGMFISSEEVRLWRYWRPDPSKQIRLRNHEEYHEAFREKFTQAVTCRLRSAYPIGSMLSGGLDSSSIVCVGSEYLFRQEKPPLHSFSAIFPTVSKEDSTIDEISYMQSVIKKTGCIAHFVNCDDDNPWKDMKKLIWHADNPVGIANLYIHWEIFKEAEKKGVRVLLDGFDGDSTVSHGYEDFAELARKRQWLRLIKEANLLNKNMPRPSHSLKSVKGLILRNGLNYVLPDNLAKLRNYIRSPKKAAQPVNKINGLVSKVINSKFRKKYQLDERFEHFYSSSYSEKATDIESHWEGLTSGLYAKSLESVEIASQAFSIEQRFPFFDRRLIEFCIALPPGERIYNGWTRAIFRYAMEGLLPKDVQWRGTKAVLGAGLKLNMLKYGSAELEDVIDVNTSVLEDYVDMDQLRAVYKRFAENPLEFDYDCLILVVAVHLSYWLRENEFA
jgi:asparagine synthase (glutamine-hydrolysing)